MIEWLKIKWTQFVNIVSGKDKNWDGEVDIKDKMIEEYNKYKKKHGHFSTPEQMGEFYSDGVAILDWFKKNKRGRKSFFSSRKHELKGIEIPLITNPIKERPNIKYMGYIDLVIYHKNSDSYTIYDIKTSTKGCQSGKREIELNTINFTYTKTIILNYLKYLKIK